MTVLLVTHSQDHDCTPRVEGMLRDRGAPTFRLDTDRFPTVFGLQADETDSLGRLIGPHGAVELADIQAVWLRRVSEPELPSGLADDYRAISVAETRRILLGLLECLPVFQLDPPPVVRRGSNKQLQLQLARRMGLRVPRTLITNDPEAVRAFARTCPDGMVGKMMNSFTIQRGGRESAMFTSIIEEDHLAELDGLRLCPMTFQEKIEKKLELRVTSVGHRRFTAAVDSQAHETTQLDWRRGGVKLMSAWTERELPKTVDAQLDALMARLGLNYGAIDLLVTPSDEIVFLEVNPGGEYFWLEEQPGLPISAALADVLLGRAPRRQPILAKPVLSPL